MSKNSIQDKKKLHLKQKVAWAEPRLMIKMATAVSAPLTHKTSEGAQVCTKNVKKDALHADVCSCWLQSRGFHLCSSPGGMEVMKSSWSETDLKKRLVYLEELELERERWRLRPGDLERERRRAGDRLLGERDLPDKNTEIFMISLQTAPNKNKTSWNNTQGWSTNLLLMRGGLLRHIGGGGGILRGGESLRGGGRTRWVRTAEAVISWPSIWPERTQIIESSELLSKNGRSPSPNCPGRKHWATVRNQREK